MENYTYDNGWNVQDWITSTEPLRQGQDLNTWLNTPSDFYNGVKPIDIMGQITGGQVTDPMSSLGTSLPDPRNSSGDEGEMFDKLVMAAVAAAGGAAVGAVSGAGAAGGGLEGAGGAFDMGGSAGVFDSFGNPLYGFDPNSAGAFDLYGSQAIPGDPSGGTVFDYSSPMPDISGSMIKSAGQTLAKALTGGSGTGTGTGGGTLMGQSAISPQAGYVRKARKPISQPAFLGEQGQQALGSAEDEMFNQASASRGDDVSNRSRQMAAQLRGRPGWMAWKT